MIRLTLLMITVLSALLDPGSWKNQTPELYQTTKRHEITDPDFRNPEWQAKTCARDRMILVDAEIVNRQRRLNIFAAIVVLLAVATIIHFYKTCRRRAALNALLDRKVKERTDQLEANREQLMSALREQDLMVKRLSSIIHEKVNTVRGLCLLARGEVADPVARSYVDKIGETSMQMEACLRAILKDGMSST